MEEIKEKTAEVEDEDEDEEDDAPKGPSKLSLALNKFFHHIDKGGSLKSEIITGIMVGILIACSLFMNMQYIGNLFIDGTTAAADASNIYGGVYFMSTLLAAAASLVIGIVARLPLAQTGGLVMSTIVVSTIGANTGLTYYNVLAISLISSVIYTILVSIPVTRKFIAKAIPDCIKRVLPAAAGLLIAVIALQLSGIVSFTSTGLKINQFVEMSNVNGTVTMGTFLSSADYATDGYRPYVIFGLISAVITIVCYFILKALNKRFEKHAKYPLLYSLLIGTIMYFVLMLCTGRASQIINWGRIWMVGGEDAYMNHVFAGMNTLNIASVFTKGFDFSGYTGNVITLILGSVITFLLVSMIDANATIDAVKEDDDKVALAYIVNGATNVVAPILGVTPVSIAKESVSAKEDGAKSGISSIVAAIVLLVSSFVWLFPALMSTYTATANIAVTSMYGHVNSGALAATTYAAYCVVDAVMVITGIVMAANCLKKIEKWETLDAIIGIIVVLVTVLVGNIALGAVCGVFIFIIAKLIAIKKDENGKILPSLKEIGIPTAVFALLGILMIAL